MDMMSLFYCINPLTILNPTPPPLLRKNDRGQRRLAANDRQLSAELWDNGQSRCGGSLCNVLSGLAVVSLPHQACTKVYQRRGTRMHRFASVVAAQNYLRTFQPWSPSSADRLRYLATIPLYRPYTCIHTHIPARNTCSFLPRLIHTI